MTADEIRNSSLAYSIEMNKTRGTYDTDSILGTATAFANFLSPPSAPTPISPPLPVVPVTLADVPDSTPTPTP